MLRTLQASLSLSSLFGVQTGHDVARCGAPEGTVQLHLPQSGKGLHKQVDKTHSRVLMWMYIQKSMFRPRAMMSSGACFLFYAGSLNMAFTLYWTCTKMPILTSYVEKAFQLGLW